MMLDNLVKPVMLYAAEIWGWKKQDKLESVQGQYLKWVVALDKQTPRNIVMEETKMKKLNYKKKK